MALSKHVDADELIAASKDHPQLSLVSRTGGHKSRATKSHAFAGRYATDEIPKFSLPQKGCVLPVF